MTHVLLTICARGGSKGIPGKNIKPVGGKPLIAYTIDIAKEYARKHGARIILSTDSEDIKKVAAGYGILTDYVRPDYLANDTVSKVDAIKDALLYAERTDGVTYDYILDLDVTSPIRTMQDIESCMDKIQAAPDALTIFSVSPCGRNPYFNMVEEKPDGFYGLVCPSTFTSRQTSPKVYDINGSIYVYRRSLMERDAPRAVTDRTLVYVMDHLCFDLDEPQDYDYLAWLMDSGRLKL